MLWTQAQQIRRKDFLRPEIADRLLEYTARRRQMRHNDRIERLVHQRVGGNDLDTNEPGRGCIGINDRNDGNWPIDRAQDRDFAEVGLSGEHHPPEAERPPCPPVFRTFHYGG